MPQDEKNCEHSKVLYIPSSCGMGDGTFRLTDYKFVCIECREYIQSTPDRKRIVNVPAYNPDECEHPDKIYTMGSRYVCLNCGDSWIPEPPKLDIQTNPNWEAEDKKFRDQIVETWLGEHT